MNAEELRAPQKPYKEKYRSEPDAARITLRAQGFEIVGSTPQAFAAFVAAESDKWGKVIREHGIRAD